MPGRDFSIAVSVKQDRPSIEPGEHARDILYPIDKITSFTLSMMCTKFFDGCTKLRTHLTQQLSFNELDGCDAIRGENNQTCNRAAKRCPKRTTRKDIAAVHASNIATSWVGKRSSTTSGAM